MTEVAVHAPARDRPNLMWWTLAIPSIGLVIVTLDNLVVTTALSTLQDEFNASIQSLEWSVAAYTLAFAVLLLAGGALGDRYGYRRMFVLGVAIFTAASAGCALAPTVEVFDAARAVQGIGGGLVAAVALTIFGGALPAERRGLALGLWWGIGGIAIGLGPIVGGVLVTEVHWQWIFWLNVPIGIAAIALCFVAMRAARGPDTRLDLPGLALASSGLVAIVWGLIRGSEIGWTSKQVMPALGAGALWIAAFLVWELAATRPMLPLRSLRNRRLATVYVLSLVMSFGLFGSLFLQMQFLEVVRHDTPLRAGLATSPAIGAMLLAASLAGALSVRSGARWFVALGLVLQAAGLGWLAHVSAVDVEYTRLLPSFAAFGAGLGLFLSGAAYLVFDSVRGQSAAQASAANNAIGAVGGAVGVAGLMAILLAHGSYRSEQAFTDGVVRALWIATAIVGAGALVSLLIPGRRRGVRDVVATVLDPQGRQPMLASEQPAEASDEPLDLEPASEPSSEAYPCPVCLGHGWFSFHPPHDPRTEMCQRCYGHGKVLTGSHVPAHMVRDCPDCAGRGYVEHVPDETPQVRKAMTSLEPPESEETRPAQVAPATRVVWDELREP
jgi:EmrB/QacA subfamily drug resistance transporter